MKFFVQLFKVPLCRICRIIIHYLQRIRINNTASIIRITIQKLRHIFQTEISPSITQHRKRNIFRSILHRRICCNIAFDQIKIFIYGMNLRISCPFQYSCLYPKCLSGMCYLHIFPMGYSKLRNPVNMTVCLPESVPLFLSQVSFDIRIFIPIFI